jgi:uncharacterized damage-inducible protein DinB
MLQEIRELFAYNRWANRRMLDAVARLSDEQFRREIPSSFPSVEKTLGHMLGSEWVWLQRWHGNSPMALPADWDLSRLDAIRARWRAVEEERDAFLQSLDDGDLQRTVAARTFAGVRYETPLWQMLRHVVNHATYHRGQVTTMLRQLGATPPATDLILYYRESQAAQSA